jgi:hypothetical protein
MIIQLGHLSDWIEVDDERRTGEVMLPQDAISATCCTDSASASAQVCICSLRSHAAHFLLYILILRQNPLQKPGPRLPFRPAAHTSGRHSPLSMVELKPFMAKSLPPRITPEDTRVPLKKRAKKGHAVGPVVTRSMSRLGWSFSHVDEKGDYLLRELIRALPDNVTNQGHRGFSCGKLR